MKGAVHRAESQSAGEGGGEKGRERKGVEREREGKVRRQVEGRGRAVLYRCMADGRGGKSGQGRG